MDLALTVVPLGIIGARLYYVLFSWQQYAASPISILYVWEGGLAIYGGVIGGFLGVWLHSRRKRIPLGVLTDCIAPGLALAQCIGRWGNFFNMEAYGLAITDPRLQFFPLAVLIPGDGWHMATFFYESMWDLMVFLTLWLTRKRMKRPGDTFLCYLLLYGFGRLIIEGLRMDSLMSFAGGFRVSQMLSLGLLLAAAMIMILRGRRRPIAFVLWGAALAAGLFMQLYPMSILPRTLAGVCTGLMAVNAALTSVRS